MLNKELARFDYSKETRLQRWFKIIIFICIALFSIVFVFFLYKDKLFLIGGIILGLLAIGNIRALIKAQSIIVFYDNFICIDNNTIINVSDIIFVGFKQHGFGEYSEKNFEVHTNTTIYTLLVSRKCINYFKFYCQERNLQYTSKWKC